VRRFSRETANEWGIKNTGDERATVLPDGRAEAEMSKRRVGWQFTLRDLASIPFFHGDTALRVGLAALCPSCPNFKEDLPSHVRPPVGAEGLEMFIEALEGTAPVLTTSFLFAMNSACRASCLKLRISFRCNCFFWPNENHQRLRFENSFPLTPACWGLAMLGHFIEYPL